MMMISKLTGRKRNMARICDNQLSMPHRKGAVLLVVLFIVMVITITSLSFLSESDVDLVCGQNMKLRTEMDYTAESGLEHAKGLIISPQDIASEYWTGDVAQQIAGGDDYYDIEIIRDDSDPTDRCNYTIDCDSYRLKGGEKVGISNITAQLRLDPCIAFWAGTSTNPTRRVTINGDAYCSGSITTNAVIHGDLFARGAIDGDYIEGRSSQYAAQAPVAWPGIQVADYSSTYYLGTTLHSPVVVSTYVHPSGSFNPTTGNPGGVRYRNGDAALAGGANINGLLVVNGDLRVNGSNSITAVKNFPSLLVDGDLIIEPGGVLDVSGLALVEGEVSISSDGGSLDVTGALFTAGGLRETVVDSSGSGNVGAIYGDPLWRAGQINGAMEFDGDDDYVRTLDNSDKLQLTNDYTLLVWIKANASQKSWAGVFSKCNTSGSTNHWTLQFNSDTVKKLVIYHPDYLPSPKSWNTGITLNEIAGAWHQVGIIRSGTTMKSFLDGNLRASGTWSNDPGFGAGHLSIGADRTASSSYLYKGLIDDLRIYNVAASPVDPSHLYPPDYPPAANLAGYWTLDEAGCDVDITAAPCKSAIMMWSPGYAAEKWEQVGGAFFRSITRE
ncbi:MAG: LamG domain-containing protein [Sedimentisphaerales bacterium]|nr:LamG domain-containing protein [Sedimentisphaerales bacterium]